MEKRRKNLRTINEFEFRNPVFEGKMRWIEWRSKPVVRSRRDKNGKSVVDSLPPNGFASAFCRIAGRVYIDEDVFWEIVEEQNGGSNERQAS